jgi:hypothetical protein
VIAWCQEVAPELIDLLPWFEDAGVEPLLDAFHAAPSQHLRKHSGGEFACLWMAL